MWVQDASVAAAGAADGAKESLLPLETLYLLRPMEATAAAVAAAAVASHC